MTLNIFKPVFFFTAILFSFAVSSNQHMKHKNQHAQKAKVQSSSNTFGEALTPQKEQTLAQAINHFDKVKDQQITIVGQVEKVCKMSGCWFTLKEGDQTVRVMFEEYGPSVPQTFINKKVRVQGQLSRKLIKPKEQEHFLKDEGVATADIKKVRKAKEVYRFSASGVKLI